MAAWLGMQVLRFFCDWEDVAPNGLRGVLTDVNSHRRFGVTVILEADRSNLLTEETDNTICSNYRSRTRRSRTCVWKSIQGAAEEFSTPPSIQKKC